MANMDTTGFLVELRRLKGVEIGEPTVRHHARAGRIGRKIDGLWVFTEEDIEAIMQYSGRREPEVKIGIRALVWEEVCDEVFSCCLLECTLRVLKDVDLWHWHIVVGQSAFTAGKCSTAKEAKAACEAAWHELLMRDVLEVL